MKTIVINNADFRVTDVGSICLINPITPGCREWLEEHTDGQLFGGALVVERRYMPDLLEGLAENGFANLTHQAA